MTEVQKHQEAVAPKVENIPKSPDQVVAENKEKAQKGAKKLSKSLSKSDIDISTYSPNLKNIDKQKATKKLGDILHPKKGKEKGSDKIEGIKTIDGKEFTKEKLKTLETSELLKMEISDRLNLITKGDKIERKDLVKGKEIEINFSIDGKKNKNLYLNTSAGQVLPVEIGNISVGGVEYKRHGYDGEFFDDKGKRLLIDDGTKITIGEPRTTEEMNGIAKSITEDYNKITKELNIDTKKLKDGDKEKLDIVREGLKKGLNQNEIKTILDGKYQDLNNIEPITRRKEVFKTLMDLKNGGFLDGDVSGEKIDKKSLETFAEKYGISAESIGVGSSGYPEYTSQTPPNLNLPEGTSEQVKKALNAAMGQLGTHENSGKADKYLHEIGHPNLNARTTPWCAAFVNWSLKQGGINQNGSLSAKSFINEGGKGHVGFKVGNQLLGGNQSNRVSLKPLHLDNVKGYYLPDGEKGKQIVKRGDEGFDKNKIPDGAIVVFDRGRKTT